MRIAALIIPATQLSPEQVGSVLIAHFHTALDARYAVTDSLFMVSALAMMALYAQFEFTKILGLGHSLWVPLLIIVVLAIPNANGLFQSYLILWSGLTTVSLIFDGIDVCTYFTS
jgi:hypothetical protein